MNIFNDDTTVIAVFESQKDLEKATATLEQNGFTPEREDKLKVINKTQLEQTKDPGAAVPAEKKLGGVGHSGLGYDPTAALDAETISPEERVKSTLEAFELSEEEAEFYTRQVMRGATLLVFETDQERAPQALEILKQLKRESIVV